MSRSSVNRGVDVHPHAEAVVAGTSLTFRVKTESRVMGAPMCTPMQKLQLLAQVKAES
jgi:hypothetical protein